MITARYIFGSLVIKIYRYVNFLPKSKSLIQLLQFGWPESTVSAAVSLLILHSSFLYFFMDVRLSHFIKVYVMLMLVSLIFSYS